MPVIPPPFRGAVGGWPRCGPKTALGLAKDSGCFLGLPEGESIRHPGSGLIGWGPKAPTVRVLPLLRRGAGRPSTSPGREAFVPARLRSEDRWRLGASGSGRFGSPRPRVRPSEEGFLCGFGQPRCRFPSADRRSRVPKGAVIPFRGLHGPPEGGSLARQTAGGAPHGVPVQAWALLPFPKEGLLGRSPGPLASGFRRAPRPLARGEVQTSRHRTSSTCDASFRGPEGPVGRSLRLFRADARVLVSGTEVSEFPMSPKRRRDVLPSGEQRGSSPGRRRSAEVTNRSS